MITNHSFLVEPVEAPTSDEKERLLETARAAQVAGTFPTDSAIRLLTDDYGWNESERRHSMAAARLALAYWGHAWGYLATNHPAPPGPLSEHELREAWNRQSDPFNEWDSLDTGEQLAWAQARAIAADRANHSTPTRLRHCPTHGQQPPEAWGCPECLRELREELAAARLQQQEPVSPADHIPDPALCGLNHPTPAEPGRVERLLDGKPYPTPPAEGEVGELVAELERLGSDYDGPSPPQQSITLFRAADLLQQQAAELAMLRQRVAPVPVSERLPDTSDPSECRMPEGDCWWFDPVAGGLSMDGAWYMDTYQICYTHWLPANAIPALSEYRPHD